MNNQKLIIKLEEEKIKTIKVSMANQTDITESEIKKLKDLRSRCSLNYINLAKLVISINDYLSNNIQEKIMEDYLIEIKNNTGIDNLRSLLLDYEDGEGIGDYYKEMQIKENVMKYRDDYNNMIKVFFKIFEESF